MPDKKTVSFARIGDLSTDEELDAFLDALGFAPDEPAEPAPKLRSPKLGSRKADHHSTRKNLDVKGPN